MAERWITKSILASLSHLSLKVILADRDLVEQGAEEILEGAREKEVIILLLKQVWLTMSYIGGFSCRWGSFWCHHTFGFGVEGQGAGNSTSSMQNVFFASLI